MRNPLAFFVRCLLAAVLVPTVLACDRAPKSEPAPLAPPPAVQAAVASAESAEIPLPSSEEGAAEPAESALAAPEAPKITPFGVPECDNYVKQYLTCVEGRVPPEQKGALLEAFEANRTKWRALAAMREGAVALTIACRTAAQKSKEALSVDYGCEF
jgi:hypothetical protein